MAAVNVTVRVDENTKRDFDAFCENVGMNITTAFNLYMRAVLRTRELPFSITDNNTPRRGQSRAALMSAFQTAQEKSVINGTDKMSMEEIDAEIAAYRQEKRALQL